MTQYVFHYFQLSLLLMTESRRVLFLHTELLEKKEVKFFFFSFPELNSMHWANSVYFIMCWPYLTLVSHKVQVQNTITTLIFSGT